METKQTFTALSRDLLIPMCKSVAYDQSAMHAASKLVSLSAQKKGFDTAGGHVDIPCSGDECTNHGRVSFGEYIEETYTSWKCSQETCTGKWSYELANTRFC